MISTTRFEKWDIVLVPFPFSDQSSTKKRPALIVSPDEYNTGADVIITFITSKLNVLPRLGDYVIQQWGNANLPRPSMIRMKFATIDKSIILKKLGKLDSEDIETFDSELVRFFSE